MGTFSRCTQCTGDGCRMWFMGADNSVVAWPGLTSTAFIHVTFMTARNVTFYNDLENSWFYFQVLGVSKWMELIHSGRLLFKDGGLASACVWNIHLVYINLVESVTFEFGECCGNSG